MHGVQCENTSTVFEGCPATMEEDGDGATYRLKSFNTAVTVVEFESCLTTVLG